MCFELAGLLYYAGHGYENYGNSFMVPVDAPNPYRSANCLCVQNILKLMQEKETGLNVFLLDMCRKRYNPVVHAAGGLASDARGMGLLHSTGRGCSWGNLLRSSAYSLQQQIKTEPILKMNRVSCHY